MAGTTVAVTTKTTVVFTTSSFTSEITNISFPSITREALDSSHFGTTIAGANEIGSKTFIAACLVDGGEFTVDLHFDPDQIPPIEGVQETVTVTFPLVLGDATSSALSFTGLTTGYEMTGPLDDIMTATLTVKVSGPITIVAAT